MLSIITKPIKAGISNLYVANTDLRSLNIFYDLSWFLLRLKSTEDLRIWTRNSYYFKSHVPGLSDIDLSVLSKEQPNGFIIYRSFLKVFFPWIGEVNWYPEAIVKEMYSLANRIEMSRDPQLTSIHSSDLPDATDAEKFVFLIRMLEYDLAGLGSNPAARIRKWAYHWDLIKSESNPAEKEYFCKHLGIETVIELALEFVPLDKRSIVNKALHSAFLDSERFDWLMPHKYINLYDFNKESCELFFPEVTQAQIDWEFWGVCTQAYWLPRSSFQEHLEKLNQIKSADYPESRMCMRQRILEHIQKNF